MEEDMGVYVGTILWSPLKSLYKIRVLLVLMAAHMVPAPSFLSCEVGWEAVIDGMQKTGYRSISE